MAAWLKDEIKYRADRLFMPALFQGARLLRRIAARLAARHVNVAILMQVAGFDVERLGRRGY